MNKNSKHTTLFDLANKLAIPEMFEHNGPGEGNRITNNFLKRLTEKAAVVFKNSNHSQELICGNNEFAVDFYFEDEKTIVEIALGLGNPMSEFEKDIFKAILAKVYCNKNIKRLIFISKPGAIKRHNRNSSKSIMNFANSKYGIKIEIKELIVNEVKPNETRKTI